MISAKPTEHLTGILLEGEYEDLYEMVESIYRMTGLEEDYDDPYWSVKTRLLGICYDIRHAYQGDRHVKLVDNGANEELMKGHSMIMPKQNLHYAVEVLFPEAVFVAMAAPEMYITSYFYYGDSARRRKKKEEDKNIFAQKYSDYIRDRAMIDMLSGVILSALAEVIGDEEFEKIIRLKERQYGEDYVHYATQYVDKCNIEYLKTKPEKRKDKIRNIAKRLAKNPDAYLKLKAGFEAAARKYSCSIHELHDPTIEYPDDIEW